VAPLSKHSTSHSSTNSKLSTVLANQLPTETNIKYILTNKQSLCLDSTGNIVVKWSHWSWIANTYGSLMLLLLLLLTLI